MDQKKVLIIENAIKLFAKKGFSATSVQEIAKECDISKGAFYLHFKSKDELLFEVLMYYWRRMQRRVNEVATEPMTPKKKFIHQIKVFIEEIANHREFIIMQFREQAIPFNDSIEELVKRMRFNSYLFYKNHLLAIYGDECKPYVWEASLAVQSLMKNYVDLVILDNIEFDYYDVASAVAKKTDYLMTGFLENNDPPVITETIIEQIMPEGFNLHDLEEIKNVLSLILEKETDENLLDTATILLDELARTNPRQAVIKGMASNLDKYDRYLDFASRLRNYFL
ncbi:TetR/AcrR family transcriptional regulator [Guptibacillus algicola]|uniref:TetR/AcrR family transcriptional regulator n=1 Tax=Guptibacillus algicola TaxID=225844 RepID=UPI001CD55623|nr:TetR/AcrR family transcriptional regulator [Alkalihalobacillus algicola]MCA0988439.1 TetR/AcrR family transcriptional regulator; helix-turn-helix transcriptional regulator [Alkalihalobacillus algicola]